MPETRLPAVMLPRVNLCPYCGHTLDGAAQGEDTGEGEGAVRPGDFCFCMACAGPLRFDDRFVLRKPSVAEIQAFARSDPAGFLGFIEAMTRYSQRPDTGTLQ